MSDHPAPQRPGWWPDPTGRFDQRYAIRGGWTRRVRVGPAEAIDGAPLAAGTQRTGDLGWQRRADAEAGWRADPTRRFEQRWWDGQRWTRKVRHVGAVATDAAAAPAVRGRRRRPCSGGDLPPPGWLPDPDAAGERFWNGHDWTAKRRRGPARPGRRRTGAGGWWSRTVLIATLVALLFALLAAAGVVLAVRSGLG